jgi:hypothetical protein
MKIEVIVGLSALCCGLLILRMILIDYFEVRCIDCGSRSSRWHMRTLYSGVVRPDEELVKFHACRGYCSRKMIKNGYEEVQPRD